MIEQTSFPAYIAEDPALLKKRVSLMLTYEQILMVASSLAMLHEYTRKGPIARLFYNPLISAGELSIQTAIHNACVNCALSMEELEKSRGINEK